MGTRTYLLGYNSEIDYQIIDDPNYVVPDYFIFLFAKESFKVTSTNLLLLSSNIAIKKIEEFLQNNVIIKDSIYKQSLITYFKSIFSQYKFVALNLFELFDDSEMDTIFKSFIDDLKLLPFRELTIKWKKRINMLKTEEDYFFYFKYDIKKMLQESSSDKILNLINLLKSS